MEVCPSVLRLHCPLTMHCSNVLAYTVLCIISPTCMDLHAFAQVVNIQATASAAVLWLYKVYACLCNSRRICAGASATVPRLYHGVSTLVASGAIWTGGTNPQVHV